MNLFTHESQLGGNNVSYTRMLIVNSHAQLIENNPRVDCDNNSRLMLHVQMRSEKTGRLWRCEAEVPVQNQKCNESIQCCKIVIK